MTVAGAAIVNKMKSTHDDSEKSRLYLDSSAYLAILTKSSAHASLTAEVHTVEIVSSVLLILETQRNIIRLSRENQISTNDLRAILDKIREDCEIFKLRDLTLDLCDNNTIPVVTTPRSLDLVHLRTALWFHQQKPLTRFVSLDASLNSSAKELGLPV